MIPYFQFFDGRLSHGEPDPHLVQSSVSPYEIGNERQLLWNLTVSVRKIQCIGIVRYKLRSTDGYGIQIPQIIRFLGKSAEFLGAGIWMPNFAFPLFTV